MIWGLDVIGAAVGLVAGLQLMILRGLREQHRREARDRRIRELEGSLLGGPEPDMTGIPPFWRTVILIHRELRK